MIIDDIKNFIPTSKEEEIDKKAILEFINNNKNYLDRANLNGHLTASAWILNKSFDKVLLVYHNLYDSWSFVGGHADNNPNLLEVAIKEAKEETGIKNFKILDKNIFSLEALGVEGHYKKGNFVPSHMHYNVTYLLEADELDKLSIKEDENKGVKWFKLDECLKASTEPYMIKHVYAKFLDKLAKRIA